MPIIVPEDLPAAGILQDENIIIMKELRAKTQDIRPLKICILNLMPDKITTETQLLRKLSNSIIQVDITLLTTETYQAKNTDKRHLKNFYQLFSDIRHNKYDAMIITGAPIEHLAFEEVDYWQELTTIFDWCQTNVFTTLFICWASQAALYYYYGIDKKPLKNKLFGVFEHQKKEAHHRLFQGMGDTFWVPHSRNSASDNEAILNHPDLRVLATSPEAGNHLLSSKNDKFVFMAGHPEYDADTLEKEYLRDLLLDNVDLPKNYYQNNQKDQPILNRWVSDASLFYLNWLNYSVYQETDYFL
ncbi:homoserine O-succinyltransferase [Vagococcus elongatus]|uniref:Homoserine O-acetyltransferase n=1 Tax=Vagococcus elongatus TaxID=180344 RepID=A0A430B4P4_9ENTE|nr:homoserine O-succinyltransferase [Vagococcus elongatus]RSU15182.1 homoserine O-succinyltransferase [Vagococcus elongatus]